MTSGAKADGRFGEQNLSICPRRMSSLSCGREADLSVHWGGRRQDASSLWTTACPTCPLKSQCTPASLRRITRWEHEHVLEVVQQRLDANPQAMRQRRDRAEHPFATLKMRMGATHFLMKQLPKVAIEMALHVLAYNLTRVMNIMGVKPLLAMMRASSPSSRFGPQYRAQRTGQHPLKNRPEERSCKPVKRGKYGQPSRNNHACAFQGFSRGQDPEPT